MMRKVSLVILVTLALARCGGGGGGSGEGSQSTSGVRVLHGAIDAAPVDLVLDSDGVVQTVRYGETAGYRKLAEGVHAITMYRAKDLVTPLFSRSVTSDGEQKFTVLLHGDRELLGLRTSLIAESAPSVPEGAALVRLIHGVARAAAIEASGAAQLAASFGAASTFTNIAPGPVSFRLARKVDGVTLGRAEFVAEAGKAYSIFLGGEADYLVTIAVLPE